ncbi:putative ribonuclease H-like domain-containing protein [Tanacetum coccineum]
MSVPVTAKEKTNKKNDVKARSLLLMALPNEHQLTFSQYTDAKTMFAAIETRFGGNEATKKTQKTLLKQQYENFSASSTESLDSIFNRLQKIVSRLAILVWMNKAEIETMSIDDLYNNFKIVENPNGSNLLQQDLEQINEDDLEAMDLKWQLSLLSMRAKRNQDNTRKKGNNEDTSSKAMLAIDGDSEVYNDKTCFKTCLKNYETLKKQCDDLIVKLNQTEFTATTYKRGLATIEEQLITYRKNEVLFSEEVAVLKREVACKDYEINVLKSEFEKVKQEKEGIEFKIEKFDKASKDLDKLLGSQITDKSKKGLGYNVVPPPHPLIYNRPKKLDLSYSGLDEFKEPEFKGYGSENSKQESNIVCDQKSDDSKENFDDSLVKEQVESSFNVDKETIFPVDKKEFDHVQGSLQTPSKERVVYGSLYKNIVPKESLTCLVAKATLDESMLWHRRLGHINFKNINKLVKDNLVRGLPTKRLKMTKLVLLVLKGRHNRASCLHGFFLTTKDETSEILKNFIKATDYLVDKKVKIIRSDNGTEFKNKVMDDFCREKADSKLPTKFWAEAVSTACNVQNRVLSNSLGKFDGKSDEGFFVGYSLSSKAFRVYNTRTRRVEENLHIKFLENKPMIEGNGPKWLFDIDSLTQSMNYVPITTGTITTDLPDIKASLMQDVDNGEPKSAADDQKQVKDGPDNENDEKDKYEDDSSPKEVNTAGQHVNTASPEVNTGYFKLNTVDPLVNTAS